MRKLVAAKRLAVVVVVVALATFVAGVVIATVGNLLRDPICLGGGSECSGVKPMWRSGGTVLHYVGTILAFSSPLVAGVAWWQRRAHRRASP